MQDDTPNQELQHLDVLVGDWEITLDNPLEQGAKVRGRTSFEWLEGGRFLIQRSRAEDPFPDGITVIGWDDDRGTCVMHYFDSRGVTRLYDVSLEDGVLGIFREAREGDFAQRFTGRLSDDGGSIEGRWERSDDGVEWELDFELVYTKVD
jgi:Protein of unknown function (DUF1579)